MENHELGWKSERNYMAKIWKSEEFVWKQEGFLKNSEEFLWKKWRIRLEKWKNLYGPTVF